MTTLAVADELFTALDAEGVVYSHWKSNEHLDAALLGKTDLDLLVMPADRGRFMEILDRLGFMGMKLAKARQIPGVENYLGFDAMTGSLLHLDVQYRLVVGEQLIKNHHLPVEAWLMENAQQQDGVRVPAPEREMTLLYVRAMLKTTSRQLLRSIVKGGSPIPERIVKEARWLANRIDLPSLRAAAEESVLDITGDEVVDFQRRVVADDLPWQYIRDQKQSLRRRLKGYERLPRYRATPKRMTLRFRSSTLGRKVRAGIPQRTLTAPAPVVAAVGADGSGKSRLTHDLAEWLGWKLRVRHIYFGQPKGGLIWKLLGKPGSIARRKGSDLGPIARRVDSAKWLWLARRRRRLAVDAAQIANQGVVVIGERYPLPEFETMAAPMDGPRLQGSGSSLARRELGEYREIPTPDLLIVLHTDLETLRERKLDLGVEEHTAKVAAVQALSPGPGRIIIDAGPPYERVLQEAKRAVWEAIVGSR